LGFAAVALAAEEAAWAPPVRSTAVVAELGRRGSVTRYRRETIEQYPHDVFVHPRQRLDRLVGALLQLVEGYGGPRGLPRRVAAEERLQGCGVRRGASSYCCPGGSQQVPGAALSMYNSRAGPWRAMPLATSSIGGPFESEPRPVDWSGPKLVARLFLSNADIGSPGPHPRPAVWRACMTTRITYIHQHFKRPSEAGGVRSWEFARRLVADGYDVVVIAGGARRETYRESGFTVEQVPASYRNEMGVPGRLMAFVTFLVWASVVATRRQADVVLATSTPLTVCVPGLIASRLRRARFVFEVRDLWPSVPIALGYLTNPVGVRLARWLERRAYAGADAIIALSPGMADGVRAVAPRTQPVVIPNACDFDRFAATPANRRAARAALGCKEGQRLVVYAGSFGVTYDVPWTVDLAGHLKDPSVRFVLLGEGALSMRCRALAAHHGLDVDAVLLGAVSKDDVARYYAAADLVVSTLAEHPALHVNSLNKVFDALAASRPVLFNHDGWLSDLLVGQGCGWRLSRDPEAAASELRALLGAADLAEPSRASADLGHREFDRDALYRAFEGVLRSVGTAGAAVREPGAVASDLSEPDLSRSALARSDRTEVRP
jgi:glycosyltransferase involved in cell wall biosynthesis